MTTAAEFDKRYNIVDTFTPRHQLMTGRYKKSFAYFTLRERLPVILTGIIDNLAKDKDELVAKYGEDSREEIKTVVGRLSKLKYQLQTDKTFETFSGNEPDKELWNTFLHKLNSTNRTFFKACWLHAECYMYRKIHSFFTATQTLNSFDYFGKQKQNALSCCVDSLEAVGRCTRNAPKDSKTFFRLLKLNLWGNRCDLSISAGKEIKQTGNPFDLIDSLNSKVLINESELIWNCLTANNAAATAPIIIDYVCDNSGYELYTDLLLADYLIECNLADKVRFHVKALPWFISDVTPRDFHWTLEYLREHPVRMLMELGKKWTAFVSEGKFELAPLDYFWTSPYEFYKMREIQPALYSTLRTARLVIFKGDLNYRKLLGDFAWDDTEEFTTCIRGFRPTNFCTLRTVKADLICGLADGVAAELAKAQPDWMITGEYGVIQFAYKNSCACAETVLQ